MFSTYRPSANRHDALNLDESLGVLDVDTPNANPGRIYFDSVEIWPNH